MTNDCNVAAYTSSSSQILQNPPKILRELQFGDIWVHQAPPPDPSTSSAMIVQIWMYERKKSQQGTAGWHSLTERIKRKDIISHPDISLTRHLSLRKNGSINWIATKKRVEPVANITYV